MNAFKWFLFDTIGPFWSLVHTIPRIAMAPSCFPERKRKCLLRRFWDLFVFRCKTRCVNEFYNFYGMDCVDFRPSGGGYVNEYDFWHKIVPQNYPREFNHAIVLRDKYLFWLFMSSFGIPTPEVKANSIRGRFYLDRKDVRFTEWIAAFTTFKGPLFLKKVNASCGRGVYKLEIVDGCLLCDGKAFCPSEDFFRDDDFILQEAVENHPEAAKPYPKSLNTTRIITVWNDATNKAEFFAQFHRVGARGNSVDNWAVGGLAFGVSDKGEISEYGYYKHLVDGGALTDCHPDTGVVFKGMRLPEYEHGLALCLKAHSLLPGVKSIGWDLAYTPNGPMLIEGNDDWEIAPCQIVGGGLYDKAKKYFGL